MLKDHVPAQILQAVLRSGHVAGRMIVDAASSRCPCTGGQLCRAWVRCKHRRSSLTGPSGAGGGGRGAPQGPRGQEPRPGPGHAPGQGPVRASAPAPQPTLGRWDGQRGAGAAFRRGGAVSTVQVATAQELTQDGP